MSIDIGECLYPHPELPVMPRHILIIARSLLAQLTAKDFLSDALHEANDTLPFPGGSGAMFANRPLDELERITKAAITKSVGPGSSLSDRSTKLLLFLQLYGQLVRKLVHVMGAFKHVKTSALAILWDGELAIAPSSAQIGDYCFSTQEHHIWLVLRENPSRRTTMQQKQALHEELSQGSRHFLTHQHDIYLEQFKDVKSAQEKSSSLGQQNSIPAWLDWKALSASSINDLEFVACAPQASNESSFQEKRQWAVEDVHTYPFLTLKPALVVLH